MDNSLTRIAVFYDGNYFAHVDNYYCYTHQRRKRIDISGLHEFIAHEVAKREKVDVRYCQIVDAHYFRGRRPAGESNLVAERQFDTVLMYAGITTHYLPLTRQGEKGIDVWLALEAFELTMYKHFDVLALIACDGDFVPLVRKLATLGTRVLLLAWDFKQTNSMGMEIETRTSQSLIDIVTYPIMMTTLIDDRAHRDDPIINDLFIKDRIRRPSLHTNNNDGTEDEMGNGLDAEGNAPNGTVLTGTIKVIKDSYGFILAPDGTDVFFFCQDLTNRELSELSQGDTVTFVIGQNSRGSCARRVTVVENVPSSTPAPVPASPS